jgi:hypothetical protein
MAMPKLWLGGLFGIILLGLFVIAVILGINEARACPQSACLLDDATSYLLGTVGALVSAVVVSELSVTPPTQAPGTRIAQAIPSARAFVMALASAYIAVWLLSGLALVIEGWVLYPTVPQLISAAKAWIGVLIGATYAYFGISTNHQNPSDRTSS